MEHIPGLPDLILFWMNDVSVIRVSRCGITRVTLSGKHVLTLIWMIMTGGSFKIVSNWAVLTARMSFEEAKAQCCRAAPLLGFGRVLSEIKALFGYARNLARTLLGKRISHV